ncbi:MAG: 1,2-phenylacetyl-CoA epoxidase catalytic subunit [Alphaproteobacteria bacterium]|jgi:1,2-phenylacetyl-CoA epoxidase catalytic subunit
MTDEHLVRDSVYSTVPSGSFRAMLEVDRYGKRSDAFDEIISRTHDHFWDPMDSAYLNFDTPFDMESELLMPRDRTPELCGAVCDRLDEGAQIRLGNAVTRWTLSNILHGEQGALSLSTSLCEILHDPGAQEYAANQAREEARHVTAFNRYIEVRWGTPYPVGAVLGDLLDDLVTTPVVYKKLVGMQMLLEGLAMGAFANLHAHTNDPLLKRLVQLVMTDEAFHHRFGKIWAERTISRLTPAEQNVIEDWAAECFETLLFNLVNIRQKQVIYEEFGLEWEWVREAVREEFDDNVRRSELKEGANVFRVLVKTLLGAGIITDRTRHIYAGWVDMTELDSEKHETPGEAVVADGIEELRRINRECRVIGQKGSV